MKNIIKSVIVSTGFLTEYKGVRKFVGGEWSYIRCGNPEFNIWVTMNVNDEEFKKKYNVDVLKVERWDK